MNPIVFTKQLWQISPFSGIESGVPYGAERWSVDSLRIDKPQNDWQPSKVQPGKNVFVLTPDPEKGFVACPRCSARMRPFGFKSCPSEMCTLEFKFVYGLVYVWGGAGQ